MMPLRTSAPGAGALRLCGGVKKVLSEPVPSVQGWGRVCGPGGIPPAGQRERGREQGAETGQRAPLGQEETWQR